MLSHHSIVFRESASVLLTTELQESRQTNDETVHETDAVSVESDDVSFSRLHNVMQQLHIDHTRIILGETLMEGTYTNNAKRTDVFKKAYLLDMYYFVQ